jgi:thiamine pyrophosphokinase
MRIKHALVVANGVPLSHERLLAAVADADYVLAADGGVNALLSAGITPQALLGDFDSLSADLPESIVRIPARDQNYTDLDKAIGFLIESGAGRITMTGVTGGRLDHTLGALGVLAKYGRSLPLILMDDYATGVLVDGEIELLTTPGQTISLLPLGTVESIATTGLKWNLSNETLGLGKRDGTSNVATGDSVTITVGAGDLVAYIHHRAP